MHDERIGPKREAELDTYHNKGVSSYPRTCADLRTSAKDFFAKRIRFTRDPDYVKKVLNLRNFARIATGLHPGGLNPSLSLVRVIDLSGLTLVYTWAEDHRIAPFSDYRAEVRAAGGLASYLGEKLDRGRAAALDFVSAVLNAIDLKRRVDPFGPVWAVRWRDFEPYVADTAERWLQLLGMKNLHTDALPRWLIALKYPLASVAPLVRPTQIEADWFPFHFPSIANRPSEQGGHPMDLAMPSPDTVLHSEFIHQQVHHDRNQLLTEPRPTTSATPGNLNQQREAHHRRLMHFNNGLGRKDWIGACVYA
jgi:hypothetical protein